MIVEAVGAGMKSMRRLASRTSASSAAPVVLFLVLALSCLPYPGLQQDEVLFARPLFRTNQCVFSVNIVGISVPLMLMSYLGALKTLLFAPIFHFVSPTSLSLRLPSVFLAVITLCLLYTLLVELHGRVAARIGTFLLATDSTYVLTSTFDWGPVVVQHLLFVIVLLCSCRFQRSDHVRYLAVASLCAGIAFWDKAVAVWLAAGLMIGVVLIYPRQVRGLATARNLFVCIPCFAMGAAPLLAYNLTGAPSTMANGVFEAHGPIEKFPRLMEAAGGASLFGYLVNPQWQGQAVEPVSALERVAVEFDKACFGPTHNALVIMICVSLAALLLECCAPVRRFAGLLVTSFAGAWLLMAFTRSAGTSAHHIVLLWPLPHIMIGIVLAQVCSGQETYRVPICILIVLGTALNVANTNHYLAFLIRHGAAWGWTEASGRLPGLLTQRRATVVGVDDWGIAGPLDVATSGRLTIQDAAAMGFDEHGSVAPSTSASIVKSLQEAVWIGWGPGFAIRPDIAQHLASFANANGLEREDISSISSKNSLVMLELYRFTPRGMTSQAQRGGTTRDGNDAIDDTDAAIHYTGQWKESGGFGSAFRGTLTYTDEIGASARFEFQGTSVVLVHTKAFNRGIALVRVDGRQAALLDYYDPAVRWQQRLRIDSLPPGRHTLTIEASGQSHPHSTGRFIDVDAVIGGRAREQ